MGEFRGNLLVNPYHEEYANLKNRLFAITDGEDRKESSKLDNISMEMK